MAEVLIVLGMHRSGTSAVAGALTKLGAAAPKTLLQADHGNERGYFESLRFMHFHDELLASACTHWADWRSFDPAWYGAPACAGFKARAAALFAEEFGEAPIAVFKDPRLCRFLPFWLDVFAAMNVEPRIVMPLRSPLDVAASLNKRNALPLPEGLLLWLRHVLDADAASRALRRSFLLWRDFLADWRASADKIAGDLDLEWPRLQDDAAADIEGFVTEDLVHNKASDAELAASPDIHVWTAGAYAALRALAADRQAAEPLAKLDDLRARLDQSCALFGPLVANAEVRAASEHSEAERRRVEAVELRATRAGEASLARAQIDAAEARSAGLTTLLGGAQREAAQLGARLKAQEEAAARLAGEKQALALALNHAQSQGKQETAKFQAAMAEVESRHAQKIEALRAKVIDAEAAAAFFERRRALLPGFASMPRRTLARELIRSGLFDPQWYLAQYGDVKESGLSPLRHYLEQGFRHGRRPNPFFDTRWYLDRYEDVRRSGVNPLVHYATHGWREGRDPGPGFDTKCYLEENPDVKASGMNPLAHYLRFGRAEGRAASETANVDR